MLSLQLYRDMVGKFVPTLLPKIINTLNYLEGALQGKLSILRLIIERQDMIASTLVPFIVIFLIYQLLFVLLWGATPFQRLIGIRSSGNFLVQRIGGIIRTLLGIITFFFLIFDLPALFRRRTLKEVLSRSSLISPFGERLFFGIFVLLLIFITLFVGRPLQEESALKINIEYSSLTEVKSMDLGIKSKLGFIPVECRSKLSENFLVLPTYFRDEQGKAKKGISIYDKESTALGALREYEGPDLLSLVVQMSKKDLFFRFKYPHLFGLLEKGGEWPLETGEMASYEIYNLLDRSLQINLISAWKHVLKNGPFVEGYLEIKKAIVKYYSQAVASRNLSVSDFKIVTIGDGKFLNFTSSGQDNYYSLYLSLQSLRTTSFEFFFDEQSVKSSEMATMFLRELLGSSLWHYQGLAKWQEEVEDEGRGKFSLLEMVDLFGKEWKKNSLRQSADEQFYAQLDTMALGLIGPEGQEHSKMNKQLVALLEQYMAIYPKGRELSPKSGFDFISKTSKLIQFLNVGRIEKL